ncbi:MAG: hypothetical protein FD167_1702 [bacterium]|nr:MAG: hypothetical protein FD167_1702 [bacterium]
MRNYRKKQKIQGEVMEKLLHKGKYKTIPTELKEEEFNKYVLPHLTMPKRGPKCKIGYWLVFNAN